VRVKSGASRYLIDFGVYLGATLACCALTCWVLQLWRADPGIPLMYGTGDELTAAMSAKWLIENPWIFYNPHLGMPFGTAMFNVPQPDVFLYLIIKLLGLTTSRFGLVMNLFYLLTFPATLLCTIYVLRQLKIGHPAALLGAFLYTFLPFHFMSGEGRLFLMAYYFVPLVVLLMFRVTSDQPPLLREGEAKWSLPAWRSKRSIGPIVICLIAGSSGVYYAFFACFLIMVVGIAAAAAQRRLAPLISALLLTSLIAMTVLLCLSPHFLYGHGNPVARVTGDAETYALKISQLLLPLSGHRWLRLALLKNSYYFNAPLVNENDAATLGFIGSLGFILLLGWAAARVMGATFHWLARDDQRLLSVAALLILAATLLATIGGFGSLFALLISSQIRSYNRICVFIAFFAFLAVALVIDRGIGARLVRRSSKLLYAAGLLLLTAVGLYDQTSTSFIPDYVKVERAFRSDAEFVRTIEKKLPPGAMIFQLPYLTFPEAAEYDLARGYLHSRHLRWSYGAMVSEQSDLWTRAAKELPVPEMTRRVAEAGFSGIYLDRRLYPDNGASIEQQISATISQPPIVSSPSQLSFFSLEEYKARLGK
jgi:phosphoglycerol transferase